MSEPLIRQLTIYNFLSYGSAGVTVDLRALNVLIGPNASGKSNLLEVLAIFRATAGDLQAVVRQGGGINEYLWKSGQASVSAVLKAEVNYRESVLPYSYTVLHGIQLAAVGIRLDLAAESISLRQMLFEESIYSAGPERPTLYVLDDAGSRTPTPVEDLKPGQSVLAQRRDPERFPELTFLADQFGGITLFQDWNFGRKAPARLPQPTDLPSDFLLPDASNLGLVLHDLTQTSAKREELIGYLRRFYEPARYISTKIQGGTIQLFIEEEGGRLIPATRLSDGTLRFLCLLAILCHPTPPPVIGIEEPELGLHPDIIPTIAELLRKASERTQLFVTTHSDTLVSALSDVPESILVCEATPQGTTMKRLEAEPLREWLEKYSLGEIWRMGEIGGNRW